MLKITLLFALFITFVFADVADYLKSADRSFNPLEGKVPKMYIDIATEDLEKLKKIAQIDQENDIVIGCNLDASCLEDFETKVTMTFEVDGEKTVYKKVNFKTGGNFGRANDRIGFNLKLKGDDLLYDRKQIRVRPDATDFTHIRSKIVYDLINNWGLPSMQETYIELYINEEYFGLYYLQDSLKASWIKKHYNLPADSEVETLFNCRKDGVNLAIGDVCEQTNENIANYTQPFEEFLEKIDKSKTVEDLEKFMNVELLMKNLAMEFLFGSFDHYIIQGHNFYVYQREDGIWDMILVDFDGELGSGLFVFAKFILQYDIEDFGYRIKFEEMPKPGKKLLEPAYFNDNTEFKKALRELMVTGFNPDALYKRIDELKEFIAPYVKKAVTPREDGRLPGVINFKGSDNTHTYNDFEVGSEFDPINPMVPGIKGWIKNRFEFACEEYGFDPEEILREAAAFRGEEYVPVEETETEVPTDEETEVPANEETEVPADEEEIVEEEQTITIVRTTYIPCSDDEETIGAEEQIEEEEEPAVTSVAGEESGEESADNAEATEVPAVEAETEAPVNGEEEQEEEEPAEENANDEQSVAETEALNNEEESGDDEAAETPAAEAETTEAPANNEEEPVEDNADDNEQSVAETEALNDEEDSGDDEAAETPAAEDNKENEAPVEEQDDEKSAEESTEGPADVNEEATETLAADEESENDDENEAPVENEAPIENEESEVDNESPADGASDSQENAPVKAKKKCIVRKHN